MIWPHKEMKVFIPKRTEARSTIIKHEKLISNYDNAPITELTYGRDRVQAQDSWTGLAKTPFVDVINFKKKTETFSG